MAQDVIEDRYPGLVRPIEWEVWEAETTIGEASPRPAYPTPTTDAAGRRPALVLGATGTLAPPTASGVGDTIAIRTQAPGFLGAARYAWTYSTKAGASVSEDRRGCDAPGVITDQTAGGWENATTVRRYPHAVTLPNGDQVVAFSRKTSSGATSWTAAVKRYTASTATMGGDITVASGLSNTAPPYPTICRIDEPELPDVDGVLLVAHWYIDDAVDQAQVWVWASRDAGVTWTLWARDALEASVSTDGSTGWVLGRLRIVYQRGGQIGLFAQVDDNNSGGIITQVWQWASSDLGARFVVRVDDTTADAARGWPDAVSVQGKIYLVYAQQGVDGSASNAGAILRELGSPWEPYDETGDGLPFFQDTTVVGSAGVLISSVTAATLAIAVIPNQRLLGMSRRNVTALDPADADALRGANDTAWSAFWHNDGQGTHTEVFEDLAIVWWRGCITAFGNIASTTGTTFDNQWGRFLVGGYSSITMPPRTLLGTEQQRSSWDSVTVPSAAPSVQGWTGTGAGSVSLVASIPWFTVTTAAAQRYFTRTPTVAAGEEFRAAIKFQTVSGATTMTRGVMLGLRSSDGATVGYHVEIRVSDTQIQLYDLNALAQVAIVSADCLTGVEVLVALRDAACYAWYRVLGADSTDRLWTAIGTSSTLTDDGGAGGASLIEWGNRTVDTITARYGLLRYGVSAVTAGWADGFSTPTDLWGAVYSGVPDYVAAGLYLTAAAGPAATGDTYTISGDAAYPARHLLPVGYEDSGARVRGGLRPSPDPLEGWKGTTTTGRLAFRTPSGGNTRIERGVFVVHVERPNFATCAVHIDNGSWSSIGTLDCRGSAIALPYTRATGSHVVYVNTAGTFPGTVPTFAPEELVGGYVDLGSSKIRPIRHNTGGTWSAAGLDRLPLIELDPGSLDGTEPTTGVLTVIYPRATFVALLGRTSLAGWSLLFSSATTYEGAPRAGVILAGELVVTDVPPDWGLTRGVVPPGVLEELQTGQRIATAYAGSRETLSLPYVAALPQVGAAPIQQFRVTSTGGAVVAASTGSSYPDLVGLVRYLQGSRFPTAYVPGIVSGTPDTYSLVGENAGIYGRIVADEVIRTLQSGDEGSPVYALGVLDMEQEL